MLFRSENGTQVNQFVIGNAVSHTGTGALYISNTDGSTNAYNVNSTSTVYAYRLIDFTPGVYKISLNWKGQGEGSYDYGRVYLGASVDLPMVVLINEKTASAAELFAQALKDYGKANTVGLTSYGKGSMQNIKKLNDGSALDITVAHYNPPKSENFEGSWSFNSSSFSLLICMLFYSSISENEQLIY